MGSRAVGSCCACAAFPPQVKIEHVGDGRSAKAGWLGPTESNTYHFSLVVRLSPNLPPTEQQQGEVLAPELNSDVISPEAKLPELNSGATGGPPAKAAAETPVPPAGAVVGIPPAGEDGGPPVGGGRSPPGTASTGAVSTLERVQSAETTTPAGGVAGDGRVGDPPAGPTASICG